MSKLICSKDVDECHAAGKKICCITEDTIITPSARDQAAKYGMTFEKAAEACCTNSGNAGTQSSANLDFASKEILALLKNMLNDGGSGTAAPAAPFISQKHSNGLKVVQGSSVKMDDFDTGTSGAVVGFQELVSKDESKMSAGFLSIDQSRFAWKLTYEEIDYVISGTVTVEIDGKTYTGQAGDVLFVPAGSNVVWGSPDHAKLFYATYPSNWADLM